MVVDLTVSVYGVGFNDLFIVLHVCSCSGSFRVLHRKMSISFCRIGVGSETLLHVSV